MTLWNVVSITGTESYPQFTKLNMLHKVDDEDQGISHPTFIVQCTCQVAPHVIFCLSVTVKLNLVSDGHHFFCDVIVAIDGNAVIVAAGDW